MLKNFAQNVFKWHYFDQVYSRFTRDAKWPSSRDRQGRYGGKLRNDGSRKRRPEMRLLFATYSTELPMVFSKRLKGLETKRILR